MAGQCFSPLVPYVPAGLVGPSFLAALMSSGPTPVATSLPLKPSDMILFGGIFYFEVARTGQRAGLHQPKHAQSLLVPHPAKRWEVDVDAPAKAATRAQWRKSISAVAIW